MEEDLDGTFISGIVEEIVVYCFVFSIDSIRSGKLKIAKRRTSNGLLLLKSNISLPSLTRK